MDYTINTIFKENEEFITYLVEFKGIKYIFWGPKEYISSKAINIYFDNDIKTVAPNTIGVSLNGITSIQDLKTALEIFRQIMQSYGINDIYYRFITHNDNQRELATNLGQMLGILHTIKEDSFNTNNSIVGPNGYTIDSDTNAIHQDDNFVAWEGDANKNQGSSKGQTKRLVPGYLKEVPKVYTSTEPSGPIGGQKQLGRAAFVNLPIIMFVLSALILISSLILLSILD